MALALWPCAWSSSKRGGGPRIRVLIWFRVKGLGGSGRGLGV